MKPAIYIHDTRCTPYSIAVVNGYKTIETRTRDVLGRFVGQRVMIIRTRDGKPADVVGSAFIIGKRFYTAAELDDLRDFTLIPPGSKFDCNGRGKWGYKMADPVVFDKPIPLTEYTVISKTRSYALLSDSHQ